MNNLLWSFKERLGVLFDPMFWFSSEPFSHEWSDALDYVLDKLISGEVQIRKRTPYWLYIGDYMPIWIANYPYSYGWVEGGAGMPTRRVRKKLAVVIAYYDTQCMLDKQAQVESVS